MSGRHLSRSRATGVPAEHRATLPQIGEIARVFSHRCGFSPSFVVAFTLSLTARE